MTYGDFVIFLILGIGAYFAIHSLIRKKGGKHSCPMGGDCDHCAKCHNTGKLP